MGWIRSRLTYANVVSTLCLFLVLTGGTALALGGHNTVFSDDIVNGEVVGKDVADSALPTGRKVTSSCKPTSTAFVNCGSLDIKLPRPGLRVLIVATAMWTSAAAVAEGGGAQGICRIGVDGAPFGPDVFPGEINRNNYSSGEESVTLTNITDPNLGAGNHTIGLACNQTGGSIFFNETMVSVVILGPG